MNKLARSLLLLAVVSVSPAGRAAEAVLNGNFQSNSANWTTSGSFFANANFTKCRSCPGYAYLSLADGSAGNNLTGTIKQTVTIPAGATNASLTFWYYITSSDSTTTVKDVMNLSATDTTSGAFTLIHQGLTNVNTGTGYSSFTYNMSGFVGKTFSLMFLATTDASGPTTFRIDDVSIAYTPGSTAPAAPTNLNVVGTTSSILLSWKDNATNESNYEIQRSTLGGSFGPLVTLGANTTTYGDTVANGNIMCYQVRATNSGGVSAYAGPLCGTSLTAPSLVSPQNNAALTNTTVTLSWQSVTGANFYGVDVGRSCGGTEILNNVGTAQVSYALPVSAGTYVWRVRAMNTNYPGVSTPSGCYTFTISSGNPPAASFTYAPAVAKVNVPVTFTDTSTGSPTQWLWNFGDGSTSTLQNPSHTYASAGTRTVTLQVANGFGTNSTSKSVLVSTTPVSDFNFAPASPTPNQPVSFTDVSTGSPTSWNWTFGDGQTSTLQNPTHAYGAAGKYTVTLDVSNGAGSSATSKSITVAAAVTRPTAAFTFTPQNPKVGDSVAFTDASTGSPTSWQWSFDDGAAAAGPNVSHIYAAAKTYHVTLTAANGAGSNAITKDVTVGAAGSAPVADFTFSPPNPKALETVTFTDTSSGSPTSRSWNFGDNSTSSAASPAHMYATAGSYRVTLSVSNGFGSSSTAKTVTVAATPAQTLTAEFAFTPQSPVVDAPIQFTDRSTGNPASWSWDFSDHTTAAVQSPTHRYGAAGAYHVVLTIGAGSAHASVEHVVAVGAVPAPTISITPQTVHLNEPAVFRGAAPMPVDRWTWTFDNATSMTGQEVTYTFTVAGPHTVALSAANQYGVGGASVRLDVQPSGCAANCTTSLKGSVLLPPGVPIKGNYTRHVYLRKDKELALVAEIAPDGRYQFNAAPGTYEIEAEVLYKPTVAGIKPYASKKETIILGTSAVTHDITLDPPIVFVHGINSSASRWFDWANRLAARHPATILIAVDYQYSDKDPYSDVALRVAGELDDVLNDVASRLPSLRVIAHSKGGLVARVVGGQYPGYRSAIIDLIELGTPNQGTNCYLDFLTKRIASGYHLTPEQVQDEVTSMTANDWIASGPALHAVVGTAIRADLPVIDQLVPTCPSSCEASDGFVDVLSASRIALSSGSRRLPVLTVPYSHKELGTDKNAWLLDAVIEPYYYEGKPFPTCGGELWTDSCQSTWCSAGRGYTAAGTCPPLRTSVRLTRVVWHRPQYVAIGGAFIGPPLNVAAAYMDDVAACDPVNGSYVESGLAGYKVYRGLDNAIVPVGYTPELLAALPPDATSFDDVNPTTGVHYVVCAIYDGNNPQCASPVIVGGSTKARPARH